MSKSEPNISQETLWETQCAVYLRVGTIYDLLIPDTKDEERPPASTTLADMIEYETRILSRLDTILEELKKLGR